MWRQEGRGTDGVMERGVGGRRRSEGMKEVR